jgi:hypothetical protein
VVAFPGQVSRQIPDVALDHRLGGRHPVPDQGIVGLQDAEQFLIGRRKRIESDGVELVLLGHFQPPAVAVFRVVRLITVADGAEVAGGQQPVPGRLEDLLRHGLANLQAGYREDLFARPGVIPLHRQAGQRPASLILCTRRRGGLRTMSAGLSRAQGGGQ